MLRRTVAVLGLVVGTTFATTLDAQQPADITRYSYRTGPRFGATWLGQEMADSLSNRLHTKVGTVISQFGWQYEKQFASLEGGPVALNEFILMFGGLDQGTVIPSLTWLVGVRAPGEFEFGVGPNVTPGGVSLAVSVGQTFRSGALNIPVNFAIVPSKFGTRVSLLTGFNIYR
jgi:hypothetical protein